MRRKMFALCVDNTDYLASLIVGKVYRVMPDVRAAKDEFVRIVDESGEDYLFHQSHFVFVDFPRSVKKKIREIETIASNPIGTTKRKTVHAQTNHSHKAGSRRHWSVQSSRGR